MEKIIDFNKAKNVRTFKSKINRKAKKVDKPIENKYIKAFKNMTDEELKWLETL